MKILKKLYKLKLSVKSKNDIFIQNYIKNGNKKELMDFVKTFKDKQLRVQLTKLLDSDVQKIRYLNPTTNDFFELSKIEYKIVNRLDPYRCNKYGENIQEKRAVQQGKVKDKIKELSKILIDELLNSEELKKEIIKMEIERLKHELTGVNLQKIDNYIIKEHNNIVYVRNIDDDIYIALEVNNGKLCSVLVNYKNLFTISQSSGTFSEYTFRINFFRDNNDKLDLKEIKNAFEEILELYSCD